MRHGVSGSSELIICLADNNVSAFHRMEFYSRLEHLKSGKSSSSRKRPSTTSDWLISEAGLDACSTNHILRGCGRRINLRRSRSDLHARSDNDVQYIEYVLTQEHHIAKPSASAKSVKYGLFDVKIQIFKQALSKREPLYPYNLHIRLQRLTHGYRNISRVLSSAN